MSNERRASDQGAVAVAAQATKTASRTFWGWAEHHHIDSLAVIVVTLWLTIDVIQWAMAYADEHYEIEGMQIAAIIGAVLTPWGLMQTALFAFYANLKAKAGNGREPQQPQEKP